VPEKPFEEAVASHRGPSALEAQVSGLQRLVTYQLNEWRNKELSDALESVDSED
jgi:hypothetical protein